MTTWKTTNRKDMKDKCPHLDMCILKTVQTVQTHNNVTSKLTDPQHLDKCIRKTVLTFQSPYIATITCVNNLSTCHLDKSTCLLQPPTWNLSTCYLLEYTYLHLQLHLYLPTWNLPTWNLPTWNLPTWNLSTLHLHQDLTCNLHLTPGNCRCD